MENFRKLGISEPLLNAIRDERFEKPSDIQARSIPLILKGQDVLAGSATGSGKTLAFGAGIIQHCDKGKGLQALVLTPTRELAEQITMVLRKFSKYKPLNFVSVYGGVSIVPQMDALKFADVAIATPGRVLDHLQRNTINLSKVKILVLDEADRMLDMGFIDDVEKIIKRCNTQRQTMLFSATIADEIERLSARYMKNPVRIAVDSYVDPKKLRQAYYDVKANQKFSLLVHLLRLERAKLVMVFCNTQKSTDFVSRNLKSSGINALGMHGGFTQSKRDSTMKSFHLAKFQVLVCTDVAARGLDIPGVTHIYNYELPNESKQYIHRIGRTARAGKEGKVINLVCDRDHENFSRVMRDFDVSIEKLDTPRVPMAKISWTPMRKPGFRRGGFGGRDEGYGREGSNREDSGSGHFGRRPSFNSESRPASFGSRPRFNSRR